MAVLQVRLSNQCEMHAAQPITNSYSFNKCNETFSRSTLQEGWGNGDPILLDSDTHQPKQMQQMARDDGFDVCVLN